MRKIKEFFSGSLREFTVTKNLVLCGLMAALAVILGTFATITVGPYIRIGFSGLPNRIVEFLFGPVVGCLFGGALDILKFIVNPTGAYFFGFTFDAMLAGVIYGCFFYRRPLSVKRVVLAEFIVKLIVNCFFNTLWLSVLYGDGFFALLPLRLLKNAIMWPIDSAITFFALSVTQKTVSRLGFRTVPCKTSPAQKDKAA